MDKKELKAALKELRSQREKYVAKLDEIVSAATAETRDFTADENVTRGRLEAQIAHADEAIEAREDELRKAVKEERKQEMQAAVAQMRRELGLSEPSSINGIVTDVREHRTYERGNGLSYLKDLTMRAFGPGLGPEWARAGERLTRHALENHYDALELDGKQGRSAAESYFVRQMVEQFQDREHYSGPSIRNGSFLSYRALSTASSAGGEFVPPMYLTAQWIEFLRAGRVVANNMHHEDLPDGTMSINIPKVSAGTSVAVQGTQNTNVSDTDLQTEFVTFPVCTFAGMQVVSLQLLERSPVSFDQVVMGDLSKAHAQYVDQMVLNGSGSGGEPTGILNTSGINTVTWTQASPTVKGLYGQIGQAKLDISTSVFLPATHCFTAPIVWEWIGQSFDSNERPLVVPEYGGPFNAITVGDDPAVAEGAVGRGLNGLKTFEDNNIPQNLGAGTNQSVVVVSRAQENYLYESPVVTRALPQTYGAQMSVLLQLYNYGAFTAARYPTANSVVTGTGLASANLTFNS